jgi:RNA polymerase sigma-70 factor, ECF subfamily
VVIRNSLMAHLRHEDTAGRGEVPLYRGGNLTLCCGVNGESGSGPGGGVLDDAEAVTRAQGGDLDAYEDLVARYTAAAHRAAHLLGASDDAEDVVQEAFVKAYRKLRWCRSGAAFRPWLLTIVANETRNLHRSRRRRDALALRVAARDAPPAAAPDDPAAAALADERRAALVAALEGIDERDRDVLVCRFLLDLSEADTAAALGWPRGTVKSRTTRALHRLRSRLDADLVSGVGGSV